MFKCKLTMKLDCEKGYFAIYQMIELPFPPFRKLDIYLPWDSGIGSGITITHVEWLPKDQMFECVVVDQDQEGGGEMEVDEAVATIGELGQFGWSLDEGSTTGNILEALKSGQA